MRKVCFDLTNLFSIYVEMKKISFTIKQNIVMNAQRDTSENDFCDSIRVG